MAIIDHFKVTVSVNKQDLAEYDYDEDEETTNTQSVGQVPKQTRYIEAQDGKQFHIHFSLVKEFTCPDEANAIVLDLSIDGKYVEGRCIEPDRLRPDAYKRYESCMASIVRQRGDKSVLQKFAFQSLEITQDSVKGNSGDIKSAGARGTIEVKIWPYRRTYTQKRDYAKSSDLADLRVPEKALKGRAVTLGVSLQAETEIVAEQDVWMGSRLGHKPLAVFVFEYRTRKSLQDLMVIPRDSSPELVVPLLDRDPATLSPAEVKALMEHVKLLQANGRQLKHDSDRNIKQESSSSLKRERRTSLSTSDDIEIVSVKKSKRAGEVIVID